MKHQSVTIFILALVSVLSAWGEVSAKKKVEPIAPDTLTMLIQAGDSLMQQYTPRAASLLPYRRRT